jgi:hypothetical protein
MLKTLQAERAENAKALSLAGNGAAAQSLGRTDSLYRVQATLASELARIERELKDSQSWLHEGLCACEQCLFELRRQRKLMEARNRLLTDLCALTGKAH